MVKDPSAGCVTEHEWQRVALRKKHDREAALAKFAQWRIDVQREMPSDVSQLPLEKLADRERSIVKCDATALADLIRKRFYTSVEVLFAFARAAVVAQDTTNCLTEIFIEEGLIRAQELDKYLEDSGTVVGPLHGVPVSIKDHIKIKGLDTSTGYIGWAYQVYAEKDAVVVDILRKAGAVLYVKTQNPQSLLSLETNNNIYGCTTNPFNTSLTSGGSSGGESALIACRGSPLGVGTDIGGSIRVPAAHCGLYGLKGSVARLPHAGLLGSHDGLDAIVGCVGPLATSSRDLGLFCKVMLDAKPWLVEPPLLEMPWNKEVAKGDGLPHKLSIAILWDDGVVTPHPPITAALKRYRDALIAAGHDVIDWQPLKHKEGWDLIVKLYLLDGGAEYHETMQKSGEPAVQQTAWILNHAQGRGAYTVAEIFRLNLERETFRAEALMHWNSTQQRTTTGRPVDAILCPIAPTLAPPHNTTSWWGYSSHWNVLDLPAVVFPVGKYEFRDDETLPEARNDIEKFIHAQWQPGTYDNAPVSLQLVGRRHNEEKVLAMLDVVEKAAGNGAWASNSSAAAV